MKDIIYQLEAVKTKCLWEDVDVLDGCICRLKEIEDELEHTRKERDAAIADLTEFAKFYRRQTTCNFCKHDSEKECGSHSKDNYFINDCFEWRGLPYDMR
jgi:hypothetical protein